MNTVTERVDVILSAAVGRDLSSWERHQFLPSIRNQIALTPPQEKVLAGIERRVFEAEDDCA